jgi:hypothetical protein
MYFNMNTICIILRTKKTQLIWLRETKYQQSTLSTLGVSMWLGRIKWSLWLWIYIYIYIYRSSGCSNFVVLMSLFHHVIAMTIINMNIGYVKDHNAQSVHDGHFYLTILLIWAKHPMMHPEGQWGFRMVEFLPLCRKQTQELLFCHENRGQPHHVTLRIIPTHRFPHTQCLINTCHNT